ncbi:MAG: DUF177 domain-containing protein [Gammaproteobacteria bacterium]|nr:DUF177 domain-containing protein [Gammaproteobacteria bacterium]
MADGQAEFEFAIPLVEFPRLAAQLARPEGTAQGRVRFSRVLGLAVAELVVSGEAWLVCQRCLEPMRRLLAGESRLALVVDAAGADAVPEGLEAMIVEDERVSIHELVEEELLLDLPNVPLHEDPADCVGSAASVVVRVQDETRQTPFTQLGELLKRDQ